LTSTAERVLVKAVEVFDLVGPDGVRVGERPAPADEGSVVVDVRAVGLSFPDLLRSRGEYQEKSDTPYVLGAEFAGIVHSSPEDSGFAAGDRVAGNTTGTGAMAARIAVDTSSLIPLPESVSFEQGAAAIFNYETAIFALEHRAVLRAGETLLVHGAAGGTGTAAIQIGKALGASVVAVVSSDEKESIARTAGADAVVRSDGDWKAGVAEFTAGRGADVVFDPVGGERMVDTIRSLAFGGRWVIVGFTEGTIPQIPANRLLFKNGTAMGSFLGGYLTSAPAAAAQLQARIRELLADGSIAPIVGATYPPERAGEALAQLAERKALGKVVVTFA
jgi:NADPH2:quinone reductase